MVNREKMKALRKISCIVVSLFLGIFFLTGCESANRDCKKVADGVVKADQWFREKFW